VDKFIAALLAGMAISAPAAAHHIEITVGWLIGFNELTDEVILDDGKAYYASPWINFSVLIPGERFLVEFVQSNSRKEIVSMIPVPVIEGPRLTAVND